MRGYVLLGLVVSCGAPPPPSVAPVPPRERTAREILDALPSPPPSGAAPTLPLRPRPDLVLHSGPLLAWRPFWPLDRIDPHVQPYLADVGRDARYREAWRRYEHGDPDRAIAILSTLAAKATDPELRAAARRDLIQVLAETYDVDIAQGWLPDADALDVLAAEYARLGRTALALQLLSPVPVGVDERSCELGLNYARLAGGPRARTVHVHARHPVLAGCYAAVNAFLCEEGLAKLESTYCSRIPNTDHHRRGRIASALAQWDGAPARMPAWRYPADLWIELADTALGGAGIVGWERVVGDALYNALVVGGCDERTIGRARIVAAAAPSPTGPELPRFASLTADACRAVISAP